MNPICTNILINNVYINSIRVEVRCTLMELEGDYKKCFDFFLDKEKSINQKVKKKKDFI